jgi:hypothetical protein
MRRGEELMIMVFIFIIDRHSFVIYTVVYEE